MGSTLRAHQHAGIPDSPVAVDVASGTKLLHETLVAVSREAPRGVRSGQTKQLEKDITKSLRSCELVIKLLFAAQDANVRPLRLRSVPDVIAALLEIRGTPPSEHSWEELHERELRIQCALDPLQWRHANGGLGNREKAALRDYAREQSRLLAAIADGLDREVAGAAVRMRPKLVGAR
jgi:hypothetical protein